MYIKDVINHVLGEIGSPSIQCRESEQTLGFSFIVLIHFCFILNSIGTWFPISNSRNKDFLVLSN